MKKFYTRHIIATIVILCLLVYVWKWTPVPLWFSLIWIAGLWGLVISLLGGPTQLQIEELLRKEANILLEAKGIVNSITGYLESFDDEKVRASLLDIQRKAGLVIDRLADDTLASIKEASSLLRMLKRLNAVIQGYDLIKKTDPHLRNFQTMLELQEGEKVILLYDHSFDEVAAELWKPDLQAYRKAIILAHLKVMGYSPEFGINDSVQ